MAIEFGRAVDDFPVIYSFYLPIWAHCVDDLLVIYSFFLPIWARCKQSVGDLWLSSKASLAVVASSKAINAMYQIYKKGNDQNLTFLALMS